ncbi:LpxI family protein [Daeguia caeni]|uniref:LpxI family protein n=1 Tax=Daeguia caeni TaxID=439612 RepID=A0ABV9H4F5_9HYPH
MTTKTNDRVTGVNARDRIAIIAGNGLLPISVAAALKADGNPPFLLPLRGEAAAELYGYEHQEISTVDFGVLIKVLRQAGVRRVVLAGGVKNRPHLTDIKFNWPTLCAAAYMFGALGKGDDALLRAFMRLLERFGFSLVGAHEIVPHLLAPRPGTRLTLAVPDRQACEDITLAKEAALRLGDLDIGQGAIAAGGRVIALEGAEGTDLMIERVVELRAAGRIPRRGGVLVKMAKPQQDERADLPAIGVQTVENAARAGLSGIAVEGQRSFILGLAETIAKANEKGLFITVVGRKAKDIVE